MNTYELASLEACAGESVAECQRKIIERYLPASTLARDVNAITVNRWMQTDGERVVIQIKTRGRTINALLHKRIPNRKRRKLYAPLYIIA